MSLETVFLPAWISFLTGLALFFTRRWIADVARALDVLDARLRALEKEQADCRLDMARGHPTRAEMDRAVERLDNHATRLTILEERDLAA